MMPPMRLLGTADAVFMAKDAVQNLSSARERLGKPIAGQFDFGRVTIGYLLPALADRKDDDR
jgi:hypothetical protein